MEEILHLGWLRPCVNHNQSTRCLAEMFFILLQVLLFLVPFQLVWNLISNEAWESRKEACEISLTSSGWSFITRLADVMDTAAAGFQPSILQQKNIPFVENNTWPHLCFLSICQQNFLSSQQIWKSIIRFGIASGWRRPTSSQPTPMGIEGHNKQKTVALILNPSTGVRSNFCNF